MSNITSLAEVRARRQAVTQDHEEQAPRRRPMLNVLGAIKHALYAVVGALFCCVIMLAYLVLMFAEIVSELCNERD